MDLRSLKMPRMALEHNIKANPLDHALMRYTVFSFHPVKIITTGEGGMCLTNDPALSLLLGRYRSHGITRQAEEMSKAPDGPWYYEQLSLG